MIVTITTMDILTQILNDTKIYILLHLLHLHLLHLLQDSDSGLSQTPTIHIYILYKEPEALKRLSYVFN